MAEPIPLAPITLPDPVGWWPLAPGWWLLAFIIIASISFLSWWGVRRWQSNRFRREALSELKRLANAPASHQQLAALNALLKRVALSVYSRPTVSQLHGKQWLQWLDGAGKTQGFTQGEGQILAQGLYLAEVRYNQQALIRLIERWIKRMRYQQQMEKQHA